MTLDYLTIRSLKQGVRVGVIEAERSYPQIVSFDITLGLDLTQCVKSDDIKDTVDYLEVSKVVQSICEEYSWRLVEKLCYDLGGQILSRFPRVKEIKVQVQKNASANVDGFSAEIGRKAI